MDLMTAFRLLRPNHWTKNSILLLGVLVAWNYYRVVPDYVLMIAVFIAFILISSANYIINDILDVDFDAKHEKKRYRKPLIESKGVYSLLVLLILASALLSAVYWSKPMLMVILLLASGCLYNMRPFRAKDRAFIDVIVESLNNPLRFTAGWFLVTDASPPVIFLLLTLVYSNFLMTGKRLAEYKFLGRDKAVEYRGVFRTYSIGNMVAAMVFYLVAFVALLLYRWPGALLVAGLFCVQLLWYLRLSLDENSVIQRPEEIHKLPLFTLYSIALTSYALYELLS